MMTEHTWTEYAASFALGALDDNERVQFEAHLAGCSMCRAEVQAYQEVSGMLAQAAPQRSAPPALKARILEQARTVRPIGTARSQPARKQAWLPWAAAAGLVAALGMGTLYLGERSARVAAGQQVLLSETALAEARAQNQAADSLVAALLAPDIETATLVSGKQPSARVYFNRRRGVVVLAAFNLPPAPAGRTYQLWGIVDAKPFSLAVFNTTADGRAVLRLNVSAQTRFTVSAVTEEPAGGSAAPTTTPFMIGTMKAD